MSLITYSLLPKVCAGNSRWPGHGHMIWRSTLYRRFDGDLVDVDWQFPVDIAITISHCQMSEELKTERLFYTSIVE